MVREYKSEYNRIKQIFAVYYPHAHLRSDVKHGNFTFPMVLTNTQRNKSVDILDLSVRSYNCLRRAGIQTIGDICDAFNKNSDFKGIRGFGRQSCGDVLESLFVYQFECLKEPEKRSYLKKVVEMSTYRNLIQ